MPLFISWAAAGGLLCLFLEVSVLSSGLFWGIAVLRVAWAHLSVYEGTDVFYLFHKYLVGFAFSEVTAFWEEPISGLCKRPAQSRHLSVLCLVLCLFHLAFKID